MYTFLRKVGRVFLAVIVGIFLVVVGFVVISRVFYIRSIEVEGEGVSVAIDQARVDKNLLFFPTEKVRKQLLAQNELASDIKIQKKFPNTLVIVVARRNPIARLTSGSQELVIDGGGVVIGNALAKDSALPLLTFYLGFVQLGQKIHEPVVLRALALVTAAGSDIDILSITGAQGQALLAQVDNTSILFPIDGDLQGQLATLQTLLTGFRIKGSLPTHIDLRFGKPIVTF